MPPGKTTNEIAHLKTHEKLLEAQGKAESEATKCKMKGNYEDQVADNDPQDLSHAFSLIHRLLHCKVCPPYSLVLVPDRSRLPIDDEPDTFEPSGVVGLDAILELPLVQFSAESI